MKILSQLSKQELLLELFAANDVLLHSIKTSNQTDDAFQIEARLHLSRVVAEIDRRIKTN